MGNTLLSSPLSFMKHLFTFFIFLFSLNYGYSQCYADFTPTVNSCDQTVTFSADSALVNDPNLTYTWDFGYSGSAAATGATVSHTFPVVNGGGTNSYTVTLTVTGDSCSASGSVTTETVVIDQVPDAGFTFTTSSCSQDVNFTKTNPSSGYTYSWNFGDGSPVVSSQNPTHAFPLVNGGGTNSYTVTLTVTSTCGTHSYNQTVVIDQVPVASIQHTDLLTGFDLGFKNCNATQSNPNYTINVNDNSGISSSNITYSINWGDGNTTSSLNSINNETHLYTAQGLFTITVVATGVNGCSDTETYQFFNGNFWTFKIILNANNFILFY